MEYHPDRWAQKSAEEQLEAKRIFQRIAKAYNTLTDSTAMQNWLEFGHPDGPRSFRWTTGVPSIVKDNGRLFTVVYAVVGLALVLWFFSFLKRMGADFDEGQRRVRRDSDDDDDSDE
jgi:preprotein translocase subunit Sec63